MTLNEYLEEHNLSYKDFAREIGVSDRTVRRWAEGQNIPSREAVSRIRESAASIDLGSFF